MIKIALSMCLESWTRPAGILSSLPSPATSNRSHNKPNGTSSERSETRVPLVTLTFSHALAFGERNLVGNIQTLVAGGSETSRTAILWLLLTIVEYPEVQKKVQREIDSTLGKDGKITWMERAKLPYTYATVLEAQRWITIVPIGILRRTNADTTIGGYDVPKDSNVMSNIWVLHNDPAYWESPEKFMPERFLSKGGNLLMQRPESYLPFSMGRRSCPGEFIALIEIFQYFTALMQRFSVQAPPGVKPNFEGVLGSTYFPTPQKLIFNIRD